MTDETQAAADTSYNADANAAAADDAPVTSKKQDPELKIIKMDDGSLVEFGIKQKLKKTLILDEAARRIAVRLDFVHGEFRVCELPTALLFQAAAHGLSQKLGDQVAGIKGDIEDAVVAIDDLMDRLAKGDWNAPREVSGLAGASTLQKALMQVTGKNLQQVRAFLSTQSPAAKLALRNSARIKPTIEALEAEKAKRSKRKTDAVDTEALLGSFMGEAEAGGAEAGGVEADAGQEAAEG